MRLRRKTWSLDLHLVGSRLQITDYPNSVQISGFIDSVNFGFFFFHLWRKNGLGFLSVSFGKKNNSQEIMKNDLKKLKSRIKRSTAKWNAFNLYALFGVFILDSENSESIYNISRVKKNRKNKCTMLMIRDLFTAHLFCSLSSLNQSYRITKKKLRKEVSLYCIFVLLYERDRRDSICSRR